MTSTRNAMNNGVYGWTDMDPYELANTIRKSSEEVGKLIKEHEIDAIAFCGSSGSALAFYLAVEHKIPLMYVRKDSEQCHSTFKVECNTDRPIRNYLIVDDFIGFGSTIQRIFSSISQYWKSRRHLPGTFQRGETRFRDRRYYEGNVEEPECKGIFLYNKHEGWRGIVIYNKQTGDLVPIHN